MFTPNLSFHFEEVIPEPLRIQDIESALRDLRFATKRRYDGMHKPDGKLSKIPTLLAQIDATRGEDRDAVSLTAVVIGRGQRTERRSDQPGGRRFTSKLDSGELSLVVFGSAPRSSRELVHDVNELQLTLRDRFRRLKAQR